MTNANETLMGLEATAKDRYEEAFARGDYEQVITAAHVDLPSGERIVVSYDACGNYGYYCREERFADLVPVVNRAVCLLMLTQRLGVPTWSR